MKHLPIGVLDTPRTISSEPENGLALNVLLRGTVKQPHHQFFPHFATLQTMVSSRIAAFRGSAWLGGGFHDLRPARHLSG
jgi:hypothetical protein